MNLCIRPDALLGSAHVAERYSFDDQGRLIEVSVAFPAADYEEIRELFEEKYGPPTSRREKQVRNHLGATFTNELSEWRGERMVISMAAFGADLASGSIAYHARAWIDAEEKRHAEERRRALDEF